MSVAQNDTIQRELQEAQERVWERHPEVRQELEAAMREVWDRHPEVK